jgi:Cu-Zn family superoxide dismutase
MHHGRVLALAAIALATFGCAHNSKMGTGTGQLITVMEADVKPTAGNTCKGKVRFTNADSTHLKVVIDLEGLAPNSTHGIHLHDIGDCTGADAMTAGGHYNPGHKPHGLPPSEERHAGDLGNITADKNGKVHQEMIVDNISLTGTDNPIISRAVIVHADKDDGGQPTGNAGARIGCGQISVPKFKY